jgi:LysM repeat protein
LPRSRADYACRVDRICPLLALAADLRTVVDGFDPDHRCTAGSPALALDRATQQRLCLHEAHLECSRYREWTSRRALAGGIPRPASDTSFVQTRLVIEPEVAWRGVNLPARRGRRPGRAVIGGAAALLAFGSIAVAGASTQGFGLLTAAGPTATTTTSPTPTPSPSPSPTPSPTPLPTPSPTPLPTPRPATPTPKPTPRTYRVQSGDTLSSIAARFGVSTQALINANGITDPNSLSIGQVLIIP